MASQVPQNYETLLAEMEQDPKTSETLTAMLTTFHKVTWSYWPGLFHCYDVADLPRTNNDLEQYFGKPDGCLIDDKCAEGCAHPLSPLF